MASQPRPARPASEELDPELVLGLAKPDAYPGDPSAALGVETVQTHLSNVFLTRERVYKVRKPVALSFVSFAERAERNADCLREVALNRRLAPDVYVGVAPILRGPEGWRVGTPAEALAAGDEGGPPEHCVVMRRLPAGRSALALIEAGRLDLRQLHAIARRLAAFHRDARLPVGPPSSSVAWLDRIERPVEQNFEVMRSLGLGEIPDEWLDRVARAARSCFARAADRFEERRRRGRVVDGHGDVHLDHVWFETDDADPLLIDCIEFSEDLRRIDAASEVAFLAMDLCYRGHVYLAEFFLRRYAREADDFGLYDVVDYYASYRAAVRAKVAGLAARDAAIGPEQRAAAVGSAVEHLRLAESLLAPHRSAALVLLCGVVGTGKSTAAEAIADAVGGAVISSDRTRKHLAGLAPEAPGGSAPDSGLYAPEKRDAVYEALLERAAPVVESGRVAVLDAAFPEARLRDAARDWAERRGLRSVLVETRCDPERVRERLARRQAEGADPSDAGPELLEWSLEHFEPPDEWPRAGRVVISTDRTRWPEEVREIAARLR